MSAYVEIIFDNSDHRIIAAGSNEVIIRRTIGLKKDEYSVDHKSSTKDEVMRLLESAGFSRSNPYYIVPQGRITALTNAKDAERLNLLKDVAGTQVYDQRRTESIKVMEDTQKKREEIDESLEFIRERLDELEKEKEELKEYHEKDREKRSLEYTILDRELKEVNELIDRLEGDRSRDIQVNSESLENFTNLEETISKSEESLFELKNKAQLIQVEKSRHSRDIDQKLKLKAQKELEYNEIKEHSENNQKQTVEIEAQISKIRKEVSTKKKKLAKKKPHFDSICEKENSLREDVTRLEAQQSFIYSKQGRNSRFFSQEERDKWIHNEIKSINETIETRQKTQEVLETDLNELDKKLNTISESIAKTRSQVGKSTDIDREYLKKKLEAETKRDTLIDERKLLWRNESQSEFQLDTLKEQVSKAQRSAFGTLSRAQSSGLKAVRRIAERLNLSGVYGPLVELISVPSKYKMATEVTAGNSLFHIVVDNEDTATAIMNELFREQSGRVTFMPVSRLTPRIVSYPENDHITPLIHMIEYPSEIEKAVYQVFGKTIVALNLEIGTQIAHNHDLNAITLNGDRVNAKGVLTGGFYDIRKSKLSAFQDLKLLHQTVDERASELEDIKNQISRKDQEINEALSEINRIGADYQKHSSSFDKLKASLQPKVVEEGQIQELILEKKRSLQEILSSIRTLSEQLETFTTELGSDFNQTLTEEELSELQRLNSTLPSLKKQLQEASLEKINLEQEKNELEVEINQGLEVRLDQLVAKLTTSSTGDDVIGEKQVGGRDAKSTLADTKRQITKLEDEIQQVENDISSLEEQLEGALELVAETESRLQKEKDVRIKLARKIENLHKDMEKSISKRSVLASRREEVQRKIRELGVLPPDAFTRYESVGTNAVIKRFRELSDDLKQFSHVNKKAVEQFNSFTQQEEKLEVRKKELEKSHESIEQLILTLDMRKDEAIDRTFRQVSKSFSEVFEKLVPAGKGELIMHRKHGKNTSSSRGNVDGDTAMEDDEEDDGSKIVSVENYVGIGISVSFNSKEDDQQRIEQLSGGQKSLCALTLIFAIQQSDPAPFYLFDEIDANLDTQYRTAVASMIKELAKNAQFICTTFRTEMIHVAEKFYGVSFHNKMSSIASISQDEALQFIEGQQRP